MRIPKSPLLGFSDLTNLQNITNSPLQFWKFVVCIQKSPLEINKNLTILKNRCFDSKYYKLTPKQLPNQPLKFT